MAQKRSRPNTEAKFQDAVLQLVADAGCEALGINAVAQRAGADKVLIYRYFKDLEGLLERVAESRDWLPKAEELLGEISDRITDADAIIREIELRLSRSIREDKTTLQLMLWRRATINPLTSRISSEWKELWHDLAISLGSGLSFEKKEQWQQLGILLSLVIEAEICGDSIDRKCLSKMTEGLERKDDRILESSNSYESDTLPTNLL